MKNYVIKNSDGSEQHVMEAVHASSKEAGQTLWDYLLDRNDGGALDRYDEGWVSPFDFIIEEEECKDVSEVITDFESAREYLGLKPNDDVTVVKKRFSENTTNLADVEQFVDDLNQKHIEALIALNQLFTIAQAWNKEDGFVPDFSNCIQDKWFPWFKYDNDAARFLYANASYTSSNAHANFGSRLCFKSFERAEQFGRQFADLYNKVFL